MYHIFLTFILFMIFLSSGDCQLYLNPELLQVQEKFRVDRIEITGNYKTKDYIILRELILKPGDFVTPREIERDRLRILNTKLFERVNAEKKIVNGLNVLEFQVTERLYILPFPVFKINEKDWTKISYGMSLTHNNFRGMSEVLSATVWRGYDPGYMFRFFNPWVAGEKKILLRANVFKIRKRSRLLHHEEFDENRTGVYGGTGKRFGLYLWTNLMVGYEQVSASKELVDPGGVTPEGTGKYLNGYCEIIYDNRDLRKYPSRGWYTMFWFSATNYLTCSHDYSKFGFNVSTFKKIRENIIFGFNVYSTMSSGKLSIYSKEHFGYERRIRGHYFNKYEGENLWGSILELRIPIIEPRYITWKDAPLLKKYFKNLEFGLGIHFFMDSGSIWSHPDTPFDSPVLKGVGAGLDFRLPYDGFLRVDVAVNEEYRPQVIITEGMAF